MAQDQEKLYWTKESLTTFSKGILTEANTRISERIVDEVGEEDDKHAPSAKAVYEAIAKIQSDVRCVEHVVAEDGDVETAVESPDEQTLYVVRTSEEAEEAKLYTYVSEEVGFVELTATATVDMEAMDEETIQEAIQAAVEATKPEL